MKKKLGCRRSWAGLLELWSGATEYPNRMNYKWWSGVELVEWSDCFGSGVLPKRPIDDPDSK